MPDPGPHLEQFVSDRAATLVLSGEWVASYCKEVESLAQLAPTDVSRLTIDIGGIQRLDTFGAWSIETIHQSATTAGVPAQLVGISDQNAGLLTEMNKATLSVPLARRSRTRVLDSVEALGRGLAAVGEDLLSLLAMLGSLLLSLLPG